MNTYDYIVIGAGSAGCLLAKRLSADSSRRVLLLEAGGKDRHPYIHIPATFYKLFRQKEDWAFETVPQPGMNDRRMFQPRGKVLGGSSSINAMIYIRGHRRDYDHWSELGNRGWSYEEVLPYFRKTEDNLTYEDEFHGRGGELGVCQHRWRHPISEAMLKAAVQAGHALNEDFNGARQEGFGFYQVTQRGGRRCSAAAAFLEPVKGRPNLDIQTGARVLEVLIKAGSAEGVRYERGGQSRQAMAAGEIILCAGAFQSPQLLMLSGVMEKN